MREGRYAEESLHQEDNEGGWTRREYIEVNGTEKAYDSGRDVGKSINTPSVWGRCQQQRQRYAMGGTDLRPHRRPKAAPLS